MNNKIRLGVIVSFILLVVAVVLKGVFAPASSTATSTALAGCTPQPVKLLTGSAKFNFLKDPQLTKVLADNCLELVLTKSGAFADDSAKAKEFDAVWPAGANAAADFAKAMGSSQTYPIFSTPLAVASWNQLLPVLRANGLTKDHGNGFVSFEMDQALNVMMKGTRWNQLKDNTVFDVNKSFLVNTPDVRKSNTGALFVAALAYIQNGHEVPADIARAQTLTEKLSPVITKQGYQEGTLAGPFEDYLGQGIGKAPLVLIYESQFVEAKKAGQLKKNHFLLYPRPGLVLKHVLVAKSEQGQKLGEILSSAPIQELAAQYGFRTNDSAVFEKAMAQLGLPAPELVDLADAPSTLVLDAMLKTLINKVEGN